ncbi:MAG: hypothetical protein IMF26_03135 [Candidatus Fermentithermobacillus carboniphilus]|uniref:Peptidase MA-like domain-containing protein n=1 Tax=Candidatus Fermentithermobacillus carboniphilus TaxID=3085328 RepID=A0AAT9LET3_9FIRM|nr:MAG: hypothetical protein IMF26_03135 [Candidatus Fermentithermobacillus carboniphilus]
MQKRLKIILNIVAVLIFVSIIIFLPTFNLKTNKMISKETDNFVFYYEKQDESAVLDMADILEKSCKKINSAMNFNRNGKTEIYIYPDLRIFHTKKYGYLGRIVCPDWYIGDNRKDKVIIVSPLNPGPVHDYISVVQAVVHEYVHTIIYEINRKTPKFLNEGLAGYLSGNTKPNYPLENVPSIQDTKINNPITFANKGLYAFSYTYIEFLDKNYGMNKIMNLIRNPSAYEEVFGVSEEDIYKQWVKYIEDNYLSVK